MNRGPLPGTTTTDFVAKTTAAWGDPPDWILALATEATRTTLRATARRIGYSDAVVSQVMSATYKGAIGRVEQSVRGALMGVTVDCPVLGEIGRDRCGREQREPFRATSALRAHLYHACRKCPQSESPK